MITRTLRHISAWIFQEEADISDAVTRATERLNAYSIGREMVGSALLSYTGSLLIQRNWATSALAAFTACSAVAVYILSIPVLLHFFADNEQRVHKLSYHLWKAVCMGSTLLALGMRCHWTTLGALVTDFIVSLPNKRDSYSIYRIPIFLVFVP